MEVYVVIDVDDDGVPYVIAAYPEKWRADLRAMGTGFYIAEGPLLVDGHDSDGDES